MSAEFGNSISTTSNSSSWLQFARADSRNVILAIADPSPEAKLYVDTSFQGNPKERAPKYAITLITYNVKDKEANKRTIHFINEGQLVSIANSLLNTNTGFYDQRTNKYKPLIVDYKGSVDKSIGKVVSRMLTVTYTDDKKTGYYFNLKKVDGKANEAGAIIPVPSGTVYFEGSIFIADSAAQAFGADVDLYVRSKKTAQVLDYRSKNFSGLNS